MKRVWVVVTAIAIAIGGCGNKSDDGKAAATTARTGGAATPRQVFTELKAAVMAKNFARALTLLRPQERKLFVGLTFLDLAMPVLLKISTSKQAVDAYADITSKHNLNIDETELMDVAQSRDFGALRPYFDKVLAGKDLAALWADTAAVLPEERNRWPNIVVGEASVDGAKAKVALTLPGRDGAAIYYAIKVADRWYMDMDAFGKTRRRPPLR